MKLWAASIALFLVSGSASAEPEANNAVAATVTSFVDTANSACFSLENGGLLPNSSVEDDQAAILKLGMKYGVTGNILDRLGRESEGILNRSIMGRQTIGTDTVVLSIGGQFPGCKVILLRTSDEDISEEVVAEIETSEPGWKEVPLARSRSGSSLQKRSFLARSPNGQAHLLNLITPPSLESEIRFLITISRVPPNVKIPEGF